MQSSDMEQQEVELGEVNDRRFQGGFLAFQISGYTRSLDLFERESITGNLDGLKAFALMELPSLREQLVMAQDLDGR